MLLVKVLQLFELFFLVEGGFEAELEGLSDLGHVGVGGGLVMLLLEV